MSASPHEALQKQSKKYWLVGGLLILLTAVTFLNFTL